MNKLDLNLCIFTSTAGHFGNFDVYKTTIDHFEKSLGGNLDVFNYKIAHIKVRPREEERNRLPEMLDYFKSKNINTLITESEWGRGMSHQNEYLKDINKLFSLDNVQNNKYTLWLEDDSPINCLESNILDYFTKAIGKLNSDKEVLTVRFAREGIKSDNKQDLFLKTNTFDFQPNICRSRDLLIANRVILVNWAQFSQMQCEMVYKFALEWINDYENKFLIFNPNKTYSYHIGTEDYQKYKEIFANNK